MRGVGGPLLCIGDLLSDVGDGDGGAGDHHSELSSAAASPSSSTPIPNPSDRPLQPSDLSKLFQENYNQLNKALEGTDHSWTALTLKLCSALDTADKLVQTANSNSALVSEKVGVLQNIVKQGDSAVNAMRSMYGIQSKRTSIGSDEGARTRP